MNARIHSFETMGSVDGPGLRFITFLQGCNMKCLYCHNRDTWEKDRGDVYSVDDVAKKVESLKGFYKSNQGGITATGGEPLLQSEFVSDLFDRVHSIGLTTALDTSGHVELTDSVKSVVGKTDFLLLDLKSLDDKIHKKLVGVKRDLVIPFMDYVKTLETTVWLRYVYLPGYTDSEKNLTDLVEFINGFENVKRVDILPYHDLGSRKWEEMGYKYPLKDMPLPEKSEVQKFKSYVKEHTKVIVK